MRSLAAISLAASATALFSVVIAFGRYHRLALVGVMSMLQKESSPVALVQPVKPVALLMEPERPAAAPTQVAAAAQRKRRASAGSPPPRIYMYDLPARSQDGVVLRDVPRCEKMRLGSAKEMYYDCLFGPIVEVAGLRVRNIDQFAAARVFHAYMQEYPRRTEDPQQADLFYIPLASTRLRIPKKNCPTPDWLLSKLPHLNASTASRHIILNGRVAWGYDVCGGVFNAKEGLLAQVVKLALEDRNARGPGGPRAVNLHSYPYLSMQSGTPWQALPVYDRFRPYLISCMWGMHGPGSVLRGRLQVQCEEDNRCKFEVPPKRKHAVFPHEQVVGALLNATFCFEPPGDTPSRKGMVDAITFGCIPVVFHPMDKMWLWHVGSWDTFAVVLSIPRTSSEIAGIFDQLANIPPAVILKKRKRMAEISKRLALGLPGELSADHDDWGTTVLTKAFALASSSDTDGT